MIKSNDIKDTGTHHITVPPFNVACFGMKTSPCVLFSTYAMQQQTA